MCRKKNGPLGSCRSGCVIHNEGGGIVFDSVEEDEYMETINKLGANVRCIDAAEGEFSRYPLESTSGSHYERAASNH